MKITHIKITITIKIKLCRVKLTQKHLFEILLFNILSKQNLIL
jgi:hypothetical protein